MTTYNIINKLETIATGETYYIYSLNAYAHCYIDSIAITDLTNAGRRGKRCDCYNIASYGASYDNPMCEIVAGYAETRSISINTFIQLVLSGLSNMLVDDDFTVNHHETLGVHVFSPFTELPPAVNEYYAKFAEAYAAAMEEATAASRCVDDGGACNFDTVLIKFNHKRAETETALIRHNIPATYLRDNAICRGWYRLPIGITGQARKRETAARTLYKSLKAAGYEVAHWQRVD